jgi:Zn-dependent alcohol dehydrogenase
VQLTWTNPTVLQWQDTIVRVQPAAAVNVAATTGSAVYSGTGSAATVSGLQHGASYWITAFTVDQWGNVSPPVELKVTGP